MLHAVSGPHRAATLVFLVAVAIAPAAGAQRPGSQQEPTVADESPDGEATEAEAMEPPEVATQILRDILLSTDADGPGLGGLTVDLTQVDDQEAEKSRRALWIDSPPTSRGSGSQITHILEDVDYAPGDMFHVEVRVPIPAGERGEYREFDSLP